MITSTEALEKLREMVTNEDINDNPFVTVEATGYARAIRDIFHDELSDNGALHSVNNMIKDLLLLSNVQMIKVIEKEGENDEE